VVQGEPLSNTYPPSSMGTGLVWVTST